jgi:hypothetical protein
VTDGARLAARALQFATGELGVRETSRNRGPRVDEFVREGGGLDPAGRYPWCVAFAVYCYRRAAVELGLEPIARTASVGKMLTRFNDYLTRDPVHGAIALHLADPNDLWSPGHAGLVMVSGLEYVETIDGNTDADGGREGDEVAPKRRPKSYWNAGFVDFGRME